MENSLEEKTIVEETEQSNQKSSNLQVESTKSDNKVENDGENIVNCPTNEAQNQHQIVEGGNSESRVPRLCADYRSDSDSIDSESDSSSSTSDTTSSSETEDDDSDDSGTVRNASKDKKKNKRTDLSLSDLPPIEDLKISVPEDACEEVGTITSIVDTLVVVESYKGSAALDVDTVLFLDHGKQTLGRIFDILGPVSEPVYAVRFNSNDQIQELKIEKGLKVFYAPKTQHTTFVFLSEVLKIKGSDASWKDNIEAPAEFQDFSDDEEERRSKNKGSKNGGTSEGSNETNNKSRKRVFPKPHQHSKLIQPSRFRPPENRFNQQNQRFPNPMNRFRAPPPVNSFPPPAEPSSFTPYPGQDFLPYCPPQMCVPPPPISVPPPRPPHHYPPPCPPQLYFTPRFSGPPFPAFANPGFLTHGPNFQQPFYQQRSFRYNGPTWDVLAQTRSPPPPPPPPS